MAQYGFLHMEAHPNEGIDFFSALDSTYYNPNALACQLLVSIIPYSAIQYDGERDLR